MYNRVEGASPRGDEWNSLLRTLGEAPWKRRVRETHAFVPLSGALRARQPVPASQDLPEPVIRGFSHSSPLGPRRKKCPSPFHTTLTQAGHRHPPPPRYLGMHACALPQELAGSAVQTLPGPLFHDSFARASADLTGSSPHPYRGPVCKMGRGGGGAVSGKVKPVGGRIRIKPRSELVSPAFGHGCARGHLYSPS